MASVWSGLGRAGPVHDLRWHQSMGSSGWTGESLVPGCFLGLPLLGVQLLWTGPLATPDLRVSLVPFPLPCSKMLLGCWARRCGVCVSHYDAFADWGQDPELGSMFGWGRWALSCEAGDSLLMRVPRIRDV